MRDRIRGLPHISEVCLALYSGREISGFVRLNSNSKYATGTHAMQSPAGPSLYVDRAQSNGAGEPGNPGMNREGGWPGRGRTLVGDDSAEIGEYLARLLALVERHVPWD